MSKPKTFEIQELNTSTLKWETKASSTSIRLRLDRISLNVQSGRSGENEFLFYLLSDTGYDVMEINPIAANGIVVKAAIPPKD